MISKRSTGGSVSVLATFILLLTMSASSARADIIHVYEGESIQAAIDSAANGDEIVVHPGTYNEAIDFVGKAVWLHSSDGPAVTTIDASWLGATVVKCVSGEGQETILEGFVVTGGGAPWPGGGGMLNENSSPEIRNCIFVDNWSDYDGGGMLNDHSSPTVTDCSFISNEAFMGPGGGMYNDESSPMVVDCTFQENISGNAEGFGFEGSGGGMCNESPFTASQPRLIRCVFIGNQACSSKWGLGRGHGLCNLGGVVLAPIIESCSFIANGPDEPPLHSAVGGGMYNSGCIPKISNCLFVANESWEKGGAMVNYGAAGGAMGSVVNCTFYGNSCNTSAGAVGNYQESDYSFTSCIFLGNSPNGIYADSSSSIVVNYCNLQEAWPGTGNIYFDPLFVDPAKGDFHLSPGSPCIDAGDSTAVPPSILTDLDGNPRFVDDPATPDTGVGFPCVDMGAYEFQVVAPCPADINGDNTVDVLDLLLVLAAWGNTSGPEDINGDGIVNVLDILEVLGQWGPC